jgi:uncharacterized protein (DUF58 family)
VLAAEDGAKGGTDMAMALRFLNGVQKRKAVVFLVSDFVPCAGEPITGAGEKESTLERLLRATARHHDMICVSVSDPAEYELPDVGLVELEDSETGELMLVDTSSANVRRQFARRAQCMREQLFRFFRKNAIDTLDISTGRPYIDAVRALFKRRARKR